MSRTVLSLAMAQLAGGQPWGEVILGTCSHFVCRNCGAEYRVTDGLGPCAFCNDCKDEVLDRLARSLVRLAKRQRRHRRVCPLESLRGRR